MTVLPVLALAAAGALVATMLRRWPAPSVTIAVLAAVLAIAQLPAAGGGEQLTLGGQDSATLTLAGSPYLRGLVGIGLMGGLLVLVVGLLGRDGPDTRDSRTPGTDGRASQIPAGTALLAAAAGVAVALGVTSPIAAVIALAATTAVVAALALVEAPAPARLLAVAREARGSAAALTGGLLALGVAGAAPATLQPPVAGLALLGVGLVAGHRAGAIPLHPRVARLADAAPPAAFPVLVALVPAAWIAVLVAWAPIGLAGQAPELGLERGLIVLAGLLTLVLGTIAAVIQDEVEHVVAYTVVLDVGVALLALASLDGSAAIAVRAWLVPFVGVRMALVGWAIAFRAAFGTTRLRETSGWARRAPMLAVALALTAAASIGWPGLLAWDARVRVLQAAASGPIFLLAFGASFGTVAALVRILWVGGGRPTARVVAAPSEVPRAPAGFVAPRWVPRGLVRSPGSDRPAGPFAATSGEPRTGRRPFDRAGEHDESTAGAAMRAPAAGIDGPRAAPARTAPGRAATPSRDLSPARGAAQRDRMLPAWATRTSDDGRAARVAAGLAAVRDRVVVWAASGRDALGRQAGRVAAATADVGPILDANGAPLRALAVIILAGVALLAAVNGLGVPRGV